ncbi:MAG: hypothetical protein ABFS45_27020 [Pseudomonadota bacterium]
MENSEDRLTRGGTTQGHDRADMAGVSGMGLGEVHHIINNWLTRHFNVDRKQFSSVACRGHEIEILISD